MDAWHQNLFGEFGMIFFDSSSSKHVLTVQHFLIILGKPSNLMVQSK